jgi:sec-independent protein translocase protein TatA
MLNIGPQELLLILIVALVVVGPRRLPEIGRSIGKGLREVRKAQDEVRKTIRVTLDEEERPTLPPRRRAAHGRPAEEPGAEEPTTAGEGEPAGTSAATQDADVAEVSRTLGQSLRELRRAREEIQRSFRVDLDAPASRRPARRSPTSRPSSTAAETGASSERAGEPSPPVEDGTSSVE